MLEISIGLLTVSTAVNHLLQYVPTFALFALAALMAKVSRFRSVQQACRLRTTSVWPVFGGFTPAIVICLVGVTGNKAAPGFYLTFTAIMSLVALA